MKLEKNTVRRIFWSALATYMLYALCCIFFSFILKAVSDNDSVAENVYEQNGKMDRVIVICYA